MNHNGNVVCEMGACIWAGSTLYFEFIYPNILNSSCCKCAALGCKRAVDILTRVLTCVMCIGNPILKQPIFKGCTDIIITVIEYNQTLI